MPPKSHKLGLAVAAVTVLAGHVAPSVDDNNRYLKVTPFANGVRVAYTVFFGEIPGASERARIDANRDGRIDAEEAKRFGAALAAQVLGGLDVEADDRAQVFKWHTVDVGMGSDAVVAGSFSIDLVAYLCMPATGPTHHVRLRDQFRITRPGETEIKVEDAPGVTIKYARVGPHDDPTHDYRFVGPGGALSDDGLDLVFAPSATTPRLPDTTCGAGPPVRRSSRGSLRVTLVIAVAVSGLALLAIAILRKRSRR